MQLKTDSKKERYDATSNCDQLDVGNSVWLYCPQRKKGISPKLTRQWQGSYFMTKQINDMVYRVQFNPHTRQKVVDRNRLWRYTGPSGYIRVPQKAKNSSLTSAQRERAAYV